MRIPDQLVKKRIEFNCSKLSLQFDVAQSLFSSYDIDAGTRALLNSLRKNSNLRYERVLDLGCGYGPIGIFVKALYPAASVTLADRDALAVAFSSHNAALNEVEVSVCASDGCRDIEGPFDLILTNYPAKLGYCGLDKFLAGAAKLLTPGGCLAIVAVRELEGELDELVAARQFAVRMRQSKPGYVLLHLERDTEGTAADVPQDPSSEVQLHLSKSCCIQTNRFGYRQTALCTCHQHSLQAPLPRGSTRVPRRQLGP